MKLSSLVLSVLASLGSAAPLLNDPEATCAGIASSFQAPDVTINIVQYLTAGTNLTLDQGYNVSLCGRPYQIIAADLCRVAMRVATSNRSEITLEAWLPTNWTGDRFLTTGNGGLSGCIQYEDIAYGTQLNFATVGANNGHNGTSGEPFYNNDEVLTDFVYRSVHTSVVVGKAITEAYYGRPHKKSYYIGCSTGGRQGFKEAQDFPEDFDGIVAGAPAFAWNSLLSWSGHHLLITGTPNASTFLDADDWALVHQDIMAQCDTLDGAADGILEDPDLCPYRPENLVCPPQSSPAGYGNETNSTAAACLTSAQVATVREIFRDYYGLNGSFIYPHMSYGSEIPSARAYYSGTPFAYTTDWFRYVIYDDPSWSPYTYSRADAAAALEANPLNIETWDGDLSAFRDRGGKVLHYHGLTDELISQGNSPRYYDHVSRTMGLRSEDLDEFYRLFRVSGMDHCAGGVGAWGIGQDSQVLNGTEQTPQNNLLLRIVEWVEQGEAPETITGYKFVNDTVDLGIEFERQHCKYPYRNECVDPENYTQPEAWQCVL